MKNSSIYKIFFLLSIYTIWGCKPKVYVNEKANPNNDGTRTIEWELRKNLREKRTGVFIYPNLGTKFSLKRGKFNGVFQIIDIDKNDTIFYCNYINNLPEGRYIKDFYYPYKYRHFRTLPLKPKIDFEDGKGFFNSKHQKEGVWIEYWGNCTKTGVYRQNKKEGIWEDNCFQDIGGHYITTKTLYKNDSIIGSETKIIDYREDEKNSLLIFRKKCPIYFDNVHIIKMINADSPARFAKRHIYGKFVYRSVNKTISD